MAADKSTDEIKENIALPGVPFGFTPRCQSKRPGYLQWDDYFMALAFLSAMRSKDPVTQVGACVTNSENKIVAVGYNGMPIGLSDDEMPWAKGQEDPLQNKYLYGVMMRGYLVVAFSLTETCHLPIVCHAELNAVLNKNAADVKNCILYSTLFPCNECAKVIIQSGIREVVYFDEMRDNVSKTAAKIMFHKAGIKMTPFKRTSRQVVINLG